MKRYFIAVIFVIGFSFNSCNDDDEGDPSIKFTEKFEMTEWQNQDCEDDECRLYFRFEIDYPNYQKKWVDENAWCNCEADCYRITSDVYKDDPDPAITILVNTENYLKYDNEIYPGRVIQHIFSYKNGIMELKKNDLGVKLQSSWVRSEIDLNTLKICD